MKKVSIYLLALLTSTADLSFAGKLEDDLNSFFDGLNMTANVTDAGAYESQAAGHFSGGSLVARAPVRQYQLVQFDMPSYRAGCAGIDLYMGSMSFLKTDKLKELGQEVMSNYGAYAADVFLATTMPELKQVRDYLQNLEQMANHASVNSCQMAQNLVGGTWPKTAASQQKICHDQGLMGKEGLFSDYVDARMKCSGTGFDTAIDKASQDNQRKHEVVLNKNLVWSILQKTSFLSGDKELAELVMSLTGTIIIDKNGKVTQVPSLAHNQELTNALLGNGEANSQLKIWRCKDSGSQNQCLNVRLEKISIAKEKTLSLKVKKIIEEIDLKLKQDSPLNQSEKGFLNATHLPILRFLVVLNTTEYGNAAVDIGEYSALIANEILQQYLSGLLQEVATMTATAQFSEDLVKDIEKRIREARRAIAAIEPKVGHKLQQKMVLIGRMSQVEREVATLMGQGIQ